MSADDGDNAREVAFRLDRIADLLENAAREARQYARRAYSGDAGDVDQGSGYQYLVAQVLREVQSAQVNMPFAVAFAAAARADQVR